VEAGRFGIRVARSRIVPPRGAAARRPGADALREQRSLFGEILDWMLAPLLLLWPMSVALTWLVAQSIANHPFDRELGEMARMIARRVTVDEHAGPRKIAVQVRAPEALSDVLRADDTDQVFFQVLGLRGELVGGDRDLPVPDDERPLAGEVRYRDDLVHGEPVRVAYLWLSQAERPGETPPLVQVAETLDKRSHLATEIIKGVILPQFVILPLAVLLVWLALARGIAPLNELQQRIRQRESHDLSPIEERGAPEEVAPLVRAINDLLARLDQSLSSQKHFLADAAHQLKTPLAGLRTQAERIDRRLTYVWPRETRSDRARFEKLKEAYVKARYSKHYTITKEELEWLGQQVEELGRVVHEVCSERLEKLKAELNATG